MDGLNGLADIRVISLPIIEDTSTSVKGSKIDDNVFVTRSGRVKMIRRCDGADYEFLEDNADTKGGKLAYIIGTFNVKGVECSTIEGNAELKGRFLDACQQCINGEVDGASAYAWSLSQPDQPATIKVDYKITVPLTTSQKIKDAISQAIAGSLLVDIVKELNAIPGLRDISSNSPKNSPNASIFSIDDMEAPFLEDAKKTPTVDMQVQALAAAKEEREAWAYIAKVEQAEMATAAANCAVEFNIIEAVCTEETGSVDVPLRRRGELAGWLEVDWEIENGTVDPPVFDAIARRCGTIKFESGEATAMVNLEVPQDPTWNVEGMYFARLRAETLKAESPKLRPVIGANAKVQVYSVNIEPFPGGVKEENPSNLQLILGFIRHNYEELPMQTHKGVLISFAPPFITFVGQLTTRELLNSVTEKGRTCFGITLARGEHVVWLLSILSFVLVLILALVHYIKEHLRLGGAATKLLRANMFSTLMQLSDESQEDFDGGGVTKALDTEVQDAVGGVWLKAFAFIETALDFLVQLVLTIYVLSNGFLQGEVVPGVVMLIVIPSMCGVLILIIGARWKKLSRLKDEALNADEYWYSFVNMAESCCNLVLSYGNGWVMTQKFVNVHGNFNKANSAALDYYEHTIWLLKILFSAFVTVVTIISGVQTQRSKMEVGSYVVLLSAANGLGNDLISLAKIGNTMISGSAAVRNIAEILNKETRREERCMKFFRKVGRSNTSGHEGAGVATALGWHGHGTDIILENVEYRYNSATEFSVPPINLRLPADSVICFPQQTSWKKKIGMDTFFRILAGILLPERGHVKMNAQWKVVYIPMNPILFSGSLMYNLTLHSQTPLSDEEIWNLGRTVGLSPELMEKPWFDVGTDGDTLRHSDIVMVSIVQALVYGVDVLLLSSIIDSIGPAKAAQVLLALRQYVRRRGLADSSQQSLPFGLRHSKTLFYTSKLPSLWEPARPDYLVNHPNDERFNEEDLKDDFEL